MYTCTHTRTSTHARAHTHTSYHRHTHVHTTIHAHTRVHTTTHTHRQVCTPNSHAFTGVKHGTNHNKKRLHVACFNAQIVACCIRCKEHAHVHACTYETTVRLPVGSSVNVPDADRAVRGCSVPYFVVVCALLVRISFFSPPRTLGRVFVYSH